MTEVTFAKSGVTVLWDPCGASLLELAEEQGLTPRYGCRSGMCGACAVQVIVGEVEYRRQTLAEPEPGMVLICKAVPRTRFDQAGGETRIQLVLDV